MHKNICLTRQPHMYYRTRYSSHCAPKKHNHYLSGYFSKSTELCQIMVVHSWSISSTSHHHYDPLEVCVSVSAETLHVPLFSFVIGCPVAHLVEQAHVQKVEFLAAARGFDSTLDQCLLHVTQKNESALSVSWQPGRAADVCLTCALSEFTQNLPTWLVRRCGCFYLIFCCELYRR